MKTRQARFRAVRQRIDDAGEFCGLQEHLRSTCFNTVPQERICRLIEVKLPNGSATLSYRQWTGVNTANIQKNSRGDFQTCKSFYVDDFVAVESTRSQSRTTLFNTSGTTPLFASS